MAQAGGIQSLAKEAHGRIGGKSLWVLGWERFRRKKLAMASLFVISLFYLGGIFGPMFAQFSYREQNLDNQFQPAWLTQPLCAVINTVFPNSSPSNLAPDPQHLLGTDRLGRDLWSRILWGMRTSVIVSLAAMLTGSIFLGVTLGALAGFIGRWVDTLIMRVGEIFLAFPGLLLVILISATIRPRVVEWVAAFQQSSGISGLIESGFVDYMVVFGALAAFSWVGIARIIRGQILSLRETDYIVAAQAIGATTRRTIFVHILPNTLNIIIIMLSAALGGAVGSELVLSWLGVGIQPPTPSLGVMIWENQSQTLLFDQLSCRYAPVFLAPSFIASAVFFCFALLGDGLNDALNPRAR